MNDTKNRTKRVTLIALFATLMVAGTFIRIPLGPVPIVLTNMFAVLAGAVLGPLLGMASVGLYLLLGALGLPVFSQGGGAALLIGPTGGFFLGYLLAALGAGLLVKPKISSPVLHILGLVISFLVVYLPGVPWLKISYDMGWAKAFSAGMFPFLIGDALKAVVLYFLLVRLKKALPELFSSREK